MHHNLASLRPAGPAWYVDPHEDLRGSGTLTDPQNYLHSDAQSLAGPMAPEIQLDWLRCSIPRDCDVGDRLHADDAAVTLLRGRLTFYTWGQRELGSAFGESARQWWTRGEPAPERFGLTAAGTKHPLWSAGPAVRLGALPPMTALYSETASHAL